MMSAMRLKRTRSVAAFGAGVALALGFLMSAAFGAPDEHQGLQISAVGAAAAAGTPELPPTDDPDDDSDDDRDNDGDDDGDSDVVGSSRALPDSGGPSQVWLWSGVALVTAGAGAVRIGRLRAELAGRHAQR